MAALKSAKQKVLPDAFLAIAGLCCLSVSVSGWLTTPEFSSQLWPGDIHQEVIAALGGTISTDAVGKMRSDLPALSVLSRLMLVSVVCVFGWAIRLRQTGSGDRLVLWNVIRHSLRRIVLFAFVGVIWWLPFFFNAEAAGSVRIFAVGVLPLWAPFIFACLIDSLLLPFRHRSREIRPTSAGSAGRLSGVRIPLLLLTLAWTGVSFWMNKCLYEQLFIPHGDSAMYEEHLWNVWHGKGFRSYLDQGLFLGEHIQVIHLLLLPLHILWPSHLLLELTESVALGFCTVPVFLIGRRHTGSEKAAFWLAMAWLLFFPMHYLDIAIDQKTFRPIALAVPALFWMIEFAERRSVRGTSIFLILALSAKEDVALITCPLLMVLAVLEFRQGRSAVFSDASDTSTKASCGKVFAVLSVLSLAYLMIAVLILIPAFRSGGDVHYSQYFGDLGRSPGELVKTAFTDPARVLAHVLSVRTALYVCVFLLPLGLTPLFSPLRLLSAVFTFVMLALLQLNVADGGDLPPVPYHHFHAPMLPVLFWAASVGLRSGGDALRRMIPQGKALETESSTGLSTLIFLSCALTAVTGSAMPCGASFWSDESPFGVHSLYIPTDVQQQERSRLAQKVVAMIPKSAHVASTDFIHTRLTHCERSYDYSDYPRAVNNYKPGVPPDTDYIVIDTGHRYSKIRTPSEVPELDDGSGSWELLPDQFNGMFLVLKRRGI